MLKDGDLIGELLVDLNGNYVVQKAIAVATGSYFIEILTKISENLHLLQTVSFGCKLSQKLLGLYPEIKSIRHQDTRKIKISALDCLYQSESKNSAKLGKQGSIKETYNNIWNQSNNFDQKMPPSQKNNPQQIYKKSK